MTETNKDNDEVLGNKVDWEMVLDHIRKTPPPISNLDCWHENWNFKTHGRVCHECGTFMVDFGD